MTWYAITTAPNAEKRVHEALTEHGVSAYYPKEKVWRNMPGRRVPHERPLVRGYVFAQAPDKGILQLLAHGIDGAIHVYGFRRTGEDVARFIGELQTAEADGDFDKTKGRELVDGARIRIVLGPLTGRSGVIRRLTNKNRQAQVILQMLDVTGKPEGQVQMTTDVANLKVIDGKDEEAELAA